MEAGGGVKGFAQVLQHLARPLLGHGARRKLERVPLEVDGHEGAFQVAQGEGQVGDVVVGDVQLLEGGEGAEFICGCGSVYSTPVRIAHLTYRAGRSGGSGGSGAR